MLAGGRSARGGDFGVRVKCPMGADRGQDDGTRPRTAKQLDRHVDLTDIHEPPHAQLKAREPFPVRPERAVVVRSGRDVAEVGDRQPFACDRLEVEDVQRLAGGVDDRVEALARLPGRGGDGRGIQQRASSQKLEQPAAVGTDSSSTPSPWLSSLTLGRGPHPHASALSAPRFAESPGPRPRLGPAPQNRRGVTLFLGLASESIKTTRVRPARADGP